MLHSTTKIARILFLLFFCFQLKATVIITPASGGTSLCYQSYTTLGDIVITEGVNNDFPFNKSCTLSFSAPVGFSFRPDVGQVLGADPSKGIEVAELKISTTTLTVTFTTNATAYLDVLTLTGIQVKPNQANPIASAGNILLSYSNISIPGLTPSSNMGDLSQSNTMAYTSSTVTQQTSVIAPGTPNNAIIRIEVVVAPGCEVHLTQLVLDIDGGNGLGSNNPNTNISQAKVYYTGTSNTFAPTHLFGSPVISPSTFFTVNGTQSLQAGTNYFWLSYDVPAGAIVGDKLDAKCTQITLDGGIGSKNPSISAPAGSRNIALPTIFSVGASRTYTSIQNAYNAIPNTLSNNYMIEVYADYSDATETIPLTFVAKTVNGYSILIRPAAGVVGTKIERAPAANAPMIIFDGADNVIIDGRPGGIGTSNWVLRNTLTTPVGNTILFKNDASYNVLTYLRIEGESTQSIIQLGAGISTGNDNNTISFCKISDLTLGGSIARPNRGIYSNGTLTAHNSGGQIINCELIDIFNASASTSANIYIGNYSEEWSIEGCHMYITTSIPNVSKTFAFIYIDSNEGGHTIQSNFLGGTLPYAAGGAYTINSASSLIYGIYCSTTTQSNQIIGNRLSNINCTSITTIPYYCFTGIYMGGSSDFICGNGNTIGNENTNSITITNQATGSSHGFGGIMANSTGKVNIQGNTISGITYGGVRIGIDVITSLITNQNSDCDIAYNFLGGSFSNSIDVQNSSVLQGITHSVNKPTYIHDNTFQNISTSSSVGNFGFCGIKMNTGDLYCINNTFAHFQTNQNGESNAITSTATNASVTIKRNNFYDFNSSGSSGSSGGLVLFKLYLTGTTCMSIVDSNTISSITATSYGSHQIANRSGAGTFIFTNNNINNVHWQTNTYFHAVYSNGNALFTCHNNNIRNVNVSTTASGACSMIYSTATTSHIRRNYIENIDLDNAGSVSVAGIRLNAGKGYISGNYIRRINYATLNAGAEIGGISLTGSALGEIYNNAILLDTYGGSVPGKLTNGININTTNTVYIRQNTVKIADTQAGNGQTACLFNTSSNTVAENNIFQNLRTGGTLGHYAEYTQTAYSTNYNFMQTSNPSQLGYISLDRSITTWKAATGANNSITGNITLDDSLYVVNNPSVIASVGKDLTSIVPKDRNARIRTYMPWLGAYEGPSIKITNILPLALCTGQAVQIDYEVINGPLPSGNVFTAELSNDLGLFSVVTNIGSVNAVSSGTIYATVPSILPGSGYRIRVSASNPIIYSPDNGVNIAISALTPLPFSFLLSTSNCSSISLSWLASANAVYYELDVSTSNTFATFVPGYQALNIGNTTSYNVTGLNAGTTYYYRVRAINGCGYQYSTGSKTTLGTPTTFMVTNINDSGPGSFRKAIDDANFSCGHDIIKFNLGLAPLYTINLVSALPPLSDMAGVTIQGFSNGTNNGTPNTVLPINATNASPMNPVYRVAINNPTGGGLVINSNNNDIIGLIFGNIGGLDTKAITINGNNNTVYGCFIGTNDGVGKAGITTQTGIYILGSNNKIGDGTAANTNLISGLNGDGYGILLDNAMGNTIQGNMIGLQANGEINLSNTTKSGIGLVNTATKNIIGGSVLGQGNIISGHTGIGSSGIYLASGQGNTILGNIIGPQANGTTSVLASQRYGIKIENSPNHKIGGSAPNENNIISANAQYGIWIMGSSSSNNSIQGNFIGTDKTGNSLVSGNTQNTGIWIDMNCGGNNIIGGSNAGEGNTISGQATSNNVGIAIYSTEGKNKIIGNIIGLGANGSYISGNTQRIGILIESRDNIIGGTNINERNVITSNLDQGIRFQGTNTQNNRVIGNYIGTDISGNAVVANSVQAKGIYFHTSSGGMNTIGGEGAGEGNVISGQSSMIATPAYGIHIASTALEGDTIVGNIIGADVFGQNYLTGHYQKIGIFLEQAKHTLIGKKTAPNIISGNGSYGIWAQADASDNKIQSNIIGLDKNGNFLLNNTQDVGIYIHTSCGSNNLIGGIGTGEGNVISGHTYATQGTGVYLGNTSGANQVIGNCIGLKTDGKTNVNGANQVVGVVIENSPNNIIGGSIGGSQNTITGNLTVGLRMMGSNTTGNRVEGNIFGLDKDGVVSVTGATTYGVQVMPNTGSGNYIGGSNVGSGNVISGQNIGIQIQSTIAGQYVQGNIIGLQKDGLTLVSSNPQSTGISIENSPGNIIGGSSASERNIISGNQTYGIYLYNLGAVNNQIKGNYIGLNQTGTAAPTAAVQTYGIYLLNTLSSITNNVISGNTHSGIYLQNSSKNSIYGNIVGLQADGSSAVTGVVQLHGLYVQGSSDNKIGGSSLVQRNIISGNDFTGIFMTLNLTTNNQICNNIIGLDQTGTYLISGITQDYGVRIKNNASGNTIGGKNANEGNIISGNETGIEVTSTYTNSIMSNIIGLQSNATTYLSSNSQNIGVLVDGGQNTIIKAQNTISGNEIYGIRLTNGAQNNFIQANNIGTTSVKTMVSGATQDYGIYIDASAKNNRTGGIVGGNTIAFNTTAGIKISSTPAIHNSISGNVIYGNGGKAIDLNLAISAGNNGKAAPIIKRATNVSVEGISAPNDTIEIYQNSTGVCQDAQIFMGTSMADASGKWSITGLPLGKYVMVLGTDANANSSELSVCKLITPEITIIPSSLSGAYCAGEAFSFSFSVSASFDAGNIFTAQLSDASGNFASPINIGTLTSTTAGTISATMPIVPTGFAYRIRVIASSPSTTSLDNGHDLEIDNPSPPILSGTTMICAGSPATLIASGGTLYNWYTVPSGGTPLFTGAVATLFPVATTTYYVENIAGGCTSIRQSITVTVMPLPSITLGTTPDVCRGATIGNITYSGTFGGPTTYSIDFNASAEAAGFVDVNNATLPASPILVTIPGGAPAGTYTGSLTVSSGLCVSAPIPITVVVNLPATANAGPNQSICYNQTAVLTGSIGGSASVLFWTSSGTGTFSTPNAPTTVYTPSPADISLGHVLIILKTDDPAGPCNAVKDTLFLSISPNREIDVLGNGISIMNGDVTPSPTDYTDFGNVYAGFTQTFTINNTGLTPLNITLPISLSGANPSDFNIVTQPSNTIAAGGSSSFIVQFSPTANGTRMAQVDITNDDCDENPYHFAIQATSIGEALAFDGSNDKILSIDINSNVQPTLTFQAWVYKTGGTGLNTIITNDNGGYDRALMYDNADGKFHIFAGTDINTNISFTNNVWQHVSVTWSPTETYFVLNGVTVFTGSAGGTIAGNTISSIGNTHGITAYPFMGKMDEIRIWNRKVCANEVLNDLTCETPNTNNGLLVNFHLNQGLADMANPGINTAIDASGNGNTGTLLNFALSGASSNWTAPGNVNIGSVCSPFLAPEIDVLGNSMSIVNGDLTPNTGDYTDLGSILSGTSVQRTFTINNTGTGNMHISLPVTLSGVHASDFVVSTQPTSLVAPGTSTTFTLTFNASTPGVRTAQVNISNDDCDENPYYFAIQAVSMPDKPLGNRGLYFDGTNDQARSIAFSTTDLSIGFWIKTKQTGGSTSNWFNTYGLIDATSTLLSNDYGVSLGNGKIVWGCSNGSAYSLASSINVNDNHWHHVMCTRNAATGMMEIYIDGNLDVTGSSGITGTLGSSPLVLGSLQTNTHYFEGQLDEIKIFNSVIPATQVGVILSTQTHNGAQIYWNADDDIAAGNQTVLANTGVAGISWNSNFASSPANPLWALRVTDNSDNGGVGLGSFRQAINEANTDTDTDYIDFSIQQDNSTSIISTASQMTANQPIFIDGYSAFGSSPNTASFLSPNNATLKVECNFSAVVPDGTHGLELNNVSNSIVRGLSLYGIGSGAGSRFSIYMNNTTTKTSIQGCFIGVKSDNTLPSFGGMNGLGIGVNCSLDTIGGIQAYQMNLISNQMFNGIQVGGSLNLIQHNYIGTDISGNIALGNGSRAISFTGANNQLRQNLISGNGVSGFSPIVDIQTAVTGTLVKGNYIGVKADLSGGLPNNGYAIQIYGGAQNNIIGGLALGEKNIIAYNLGTGVYVWGSGTQGNSISGNEIYENSDGIYLASGGNNGKLAPVITTANTSIISGTCEANDIIEVFYDSPALGITNQGRQYLGTATTIGTTWSFSGTFIIGNRITATATAPIGNTSPFSNAVVVSLATINTSAISPTLYCENETVWIPYTITGSFVSGNIFTAQLSDASGNFASPINIGTLTSTTAGTISATIPIVPTGSAYRIRVVSSTPAVVGTDNGSDISLNPVNGGAGIWIWTGAFDTNWFDCRNWDKHCLPDLSSQVQIPGSLATYPTITAGTAQCKNITIDSDNGAVVNLNSSSGGILQIAD